MMLVLKNLLFTFVLPCTVAVYVPFLIVRDHLPATGVAYAAAVLMLAIGACIYVWCVYDFASFGRGTPAPIDAPKKLVVRGLYRYTRNPMYVGVLTVVFGWALFFGDVTVMIYGVGVWIVFHAVIVVYEEPHLRRVFGGEYDAYRARTGRWWPQPAAGIE